jgi:peptidoglycan/xylan/chitin deacetylase (PgdA/CDA1 family)
MSGAAVALTFDDGPDPTWTPHLLDALDDAGARATFFVIAPRAAASAHVVADALDRGHRVELHCDDHVRHSDLTEDEVRHDTERALERLRRLGVEPRLWRTPWGDRAPYSERVAREFGLRIVGWDADTHDWRGDSGPAMVAAIADDLSEGDVVLAHDGIGPGARRTDCRETIALVGRLTQWAQDHGVRLTALADDGRPA